MSSPDLWTTSSNISKLVLSKSFLCVKNCLNLSIKKLYEEYMTRRPTFIKKMFLKSIFGVLYFLKLCPIFVCSVHNFGNVWVKKTETIHSSVLLLRIVSVFLTQTLSLTMARFSEKNLFPLDGFMSLWKALKKELLL